jgi:hypothetical protein
LELVPPKLQSIFPYNTQWFYRLVTITVAVMAVFYLDFSHCLDKNIYDVSETGSAFVFNSDKANLPFPYKGNEGYLKKYFS